MQELLTVGANISMRDQLREAREYAINDAEGYDQLLFAFERLGCALKKEIGTLKDYEGVILALAGESNLAKRIPKQWRECHTPASHLYDAVRVARNDALHQGAFARHLTAHAIQLEIILEDALMNRATTVGDFMVRNPVCAQMWQPISFIRQQMLANSFSYLPVLKQDDRWYFVSDLRIAQYLRAKASERNERLAQSLSDAATHNNALLNEAKCYPAETAIDEILPDFSAVPILVCRRDEPKDLLGILTVFDLL